MTQMPRQGTSRTAYALIAVLALAAVVMIILASLMVVYMNQAADYKGSKYKAQYVIVKEMVDDTPIANQSIADMSNDALDTGFRRAAALSATRILQELSGDAFSIAVMYSNTSDRYIILMSLSGALGEFADVLYQGYQTLSSPVHEFTSEYESTITGASAILSQIRDYLNQGLTPGMNGVTDPYPVVDSLPLGSIAAAADALMSTLV